VQRYRRVAQLVGSATLAALLLACAPARETSLEIRDLDDGHRVVARLVIPRDTTFDLEFTHSMYGGWVSERYQLTADQSPALMRTTIRTQNGGAAEYYARYGNFRETDSQWQVDVLPLQLTQLIVRIDGVGRPRVRLPDREIELLALVPSGHRVELRGAR
jgi:hypothetical protein